MRDTDPLAVLWKFASAGPGARLSADEAARWPRGLFDASLEAEILVEAELARSVVCDACSEGHSSEVVRGDDARGSQWFSLCPEEGAVEVEPERLLQWKFRAEGLARVISGALSKVRGLPKEVAPGIWKLGTVGPAKSRAFVHLVAEAWSESARERVKQTMIDPTAALLIVLPGEASKEELRLVDIEEVIRFEKGWVVEPEALDAALAFPVPKRGGERVCECGGVWAYGDRAALEQRLGATRSAINQQGVKLRKEVLLMGERGAPRYAICSGCGVEIYRRRGLFLKARGEGLPSTK